MAQGTDLSGEAEPGRVDVAQELNRQRDVLLHQELNAVEVDLRLSDLPKQAQAVQLVSRHILPAHDLGSTEEVPLEEFVSQGNPFPEIGAGLDFLGEELDAARTQAPGKLLAHVVRRRDKVNLDDIGQLDQSFVPGAVDEIIESQHVPAALQRPARPDHFFIRLHRLENLDDNPIGRQKHCCLLDQELAGKVDESTARPGELVEAENMEGMAHNAPRGKVTIGYDGSFPLVLAKQELVGENSLSLIENRLTRDEDLHHATCPSSQRSHATARLALPYSSPSVRQISFTRTGESGSPEILYWRVRQCPIEVCAVLTVAFAGACKTVRKNEIAGDIQSIPRSRWLRSEDAAVGPLPGAGRYRTVAIPCIDGRNLAAWHGPRQSSRTHPGRRWRSQMSRHAERR